MRFTTNDMIYVCLNTIFLSGQQLYITLMYYLKNEQECFIRFKATSAQREWL
jgi:hypothetical protein